MRILDKKLDVIIPVYKPDEKFRQLIHKLHHQEYPVNRIIIMNTEQKYFERFVYGTNFYEKYTKISVYHLSKREFDHGATRRKGIQKSEAPFFLMMTQDAVPEDEFLTKNLMKQLETEQVAVAYGRQKAQNDLCPIEAFVRSFNYPGTSSVKWKKDLEELGIKTFFCSNVCAAYNRNIYESLGGFVHRAIFNEDMIYAAAAIHQGYGIAYCADAVVFHSHNYSGKEQFHRNFDVGVSQAEHPEVFQHISSEGEGIKMVRETITHLKSIRKSNLILKLIYVSGCKYMGYFLGKKYKMLPHGLVRKCTMNQGYWELKKRKEEVQNIDASRGYGKSEKE